MVPNTSISIIQNFGRSGGIQERYDKSDQILLILITEYSPGACIRNSRFLCKLLYQTRMNNSDSLFAFYCAAGHKWHMNICSLLFTALAQAAPELKDITFENYI